MASRARNRRRFKSSTSRLTMQRLGPPPRIRLVAVVLVTMRDGRCAVRAGKGRGRSGVVGVHEGFLDVLKGRADLVAEHGDHADADAGDQYQDDGVLDHRLTPTGCPAAYFHGLSASWAFGLKTLCLYKRWSGH